MKNLKLFIGCGTRMLPEEYLNSLRQRFDILSIDLCDIGKEAFEAMLEQADVVGLGGSGIVRLEKLEQILEVRGNLPRFIFIGIQWETYMENQATIEFMKDNGLIISTLGGYHAVAQSVLRTAMAGFLLRAQRVTEWMPDAVRKPLSKQRLSIIGVGRIGSLLAEIAHTHFGSISVFVQSLSHEKVLGRLEKSLGNEIAKSITIADSVDEAMRADVVSIHLAYIPGVTDQIITRSALNNLPKYAVLLNFAREQIIPAELLSPFLKERKDVTYVLDATIDEGKNFNAVLADEANEHSQLWKLPNVVVTQHTAIGDDEALIKEEYAEGFEKALKEFLKNA